VRAAFPCHLIERHLGLAAVGEAHDDRLGEDADRFHLAGHAAAPAAGRLAGRVDAGQAAAQLLVGRELVEQAALEPAAVAEQAGIGQRHVLGLGHLHRDRLELPEMGRAAELAAAGADAVHDPRGVTSADLAHLDARVELAGELADELAEVDAILGVEVDGHPPLGAVHLDVDDLQLHAAAMGQALGRGDRALLALPAVAIVPGLRLRGRAHDAPIEPVPPEVGQGPTRTPDLAERGAGRRLHEGEVTDGEPHVVHELVVLGRGCGAEPHADQPFVACVVHHGVTLVLRRLAPAGGRRPFPRPAAG
jgi:hypothetical protein